MAPITSRINFGVTLLGAVIAGYILWQFLTIYANAYRLQDAVNSIAFRGSESQSRAEELREHVLGAASILHLPVQKKNVDVFVGSNQVPQVTVRYEQPVDLLFAKTYVRCQVNVSTVNLWFASKPEAEEDKEATAGEASRKQS